MYVKFSFCIFRVQYKWTPTHTHESRWIECTWNKQTICSCSIFLTFSPFESGRPCIDDLSTFFINMNSSTFFYIYASSIIAECVNNIFFSKKKIIVLLMSKLQLKQYHKRRQQNPKFERNFVNTDSQTSVFEMVLVFNSWENSIYLF